MSRRPWTPSCRTWPNCIIAPAVLPLSCRTWGSPKPPRPRTRYRYSRTFWELNSRQETRSSTCNLFVAALLSSSLCPQNDVRVKFEFKGEKRWGYVLLCRRGRLTAAAPWLFLFPAGSCSFHDLSSWKTWRQKLKWLLANQWTSTIPTTKYKLGSFSTQPWIIMEE